MFEGATTEQALAVLAAAHRVVQQVLDPADPYDLRRFVTAQDQHGAYDQALAQLRRGRKTGHWIWFVLPQLAGLGRSATSRTYALTGPDEARAYLDHPVLGPRLLACLDALEASGEVDVDRALGPVDAQKLRSSLTLFARARPQQPRFAALLGRWYGGEADTATDRLLGAGGGSGAAAG